MANHNSYYGKENSNWKGSDKNVSERAKHYRIEAKRGKASQYMCARCHKNKAHDWAEQPDGTYKPFCSRCHHILDKTADRINK